MQEQSGGKQAVKKSKPSSFVPFEPLSESPSLLWSPEIREIPSDEKDAISLVLSKLAVPQSTGPVLDITDGCGQLTAFAQEEIMALMAFPKEERSQNQFLAAVKAQAFTKVGKAIKAIVALPIPDDTKSFAKRSSKMLESLCEEYLAPHGGMSAVIEAPPLSSSWGIFTKKKILNGLFAGALLYKVVSLAQAGGPASISKSVFILSKRRSARALRKAWVEYKSIAHLWAASYVWWDPMSEESREEFFPQDLENLLKFLAIAEIFRRAGLTTFSHGQSGPILDPLTTWQLPTDLSLPDATVILSSLHDVKADLKKYAAPRRMY